jgi:hypothetical protein
MAAQKKSISIKRSANMVWDVERLELCNFVVIRLTILFGVIEVCRRSKNPRLGENKKKKMTVLRRVDIKTKGQSSGTNVDDMTQKP